MEYYSQKQKILVVDDEPDMVKLIERIIRGTTSYEITTCVNSLEVPELLSKNKYDLVITDYKMPGMNGIDILHYINDEKRFEKVIMCTAFGSFDQYSEVMSLGAFDYITKPFRRRQIIYSVNTAMQYQHLTREAKRIDEIFSGPTWEEASRALRSEFIRRLYETEADPEQLAELTGLSAEIITSELEVIKQQKMN